MSSWPNGIDVITLFADDLGATRDFYQTVFRLPVVFEDDDSVVFRLGALLANLLRTDAAQELMEPAAVAAPATRSRFLLTLLRDLPDVPGRIPEARRPNTPRPVNGTVQQTNAVSGEFPADSVDVVDADALVNGDRARAWRAGRRHGGIRIRTRCDSRRSASRTARSAGTAGPTGWRHFATTCIRGFGGISEYK